MVRCQIFLFFWALVVAVVCAVVHSHREGGATVSLSVINVSVPFECCDLDNFYTTLFFCCQFVYFQKNRGSEKLVIGKGFLGGKRIFKGFP